MKKFIMSAGLCTFLLSACQTSMPLTQPQSYQPTSRIKSFNTQSEVKLANIKNIKISMGYPISATSTARMQVEYDAIYNDATYHRDVVFTYRVQGKEILSHRDYGSSSNDSEARQKLPNELKKLMNLKVKL